MELESEIVELGLRLRDIESENQIMKNILVTLDENDTHTKNILKVLWFDFKQRNRKEYVEDVCIA